MVHCVDCFLRWPKQFKNGPSSNMRLDREVTMSRQLRKEGLFSNPGTRDDLGIYAKEEFTLCLLVVLFVMHPTANRKSVLGLKRHFGSQLAGNRDACQGQVDGERALFVWLTNQIRKMMVYSLQNGNWFTMNVLTIAPVIADLSLSGTSRNLEKFIE